MNAACDEDDRLSLRNQFLCSNVVGLERSRVRELGIDLFVLLEIP
jgi:hypothetical protein